jgi:hypothetical protein
MMNCKEGVLVFNKESCNIYSINYYVKSRLRESMLFKEVKKVLSGSQLKII